MKRLLLICLVFLGVALTVKANGEPDFASKYLMLYGQTYDIDCKTGEATHTKREADGKNIYVRRRGKQFLELVVVKQKEDHTFYMLNLTGYLSDKFLQQVLKM